jgi:hypothetical protein
MGEAMEAGTIIIAITEGVVGMEVVQARQKIKREMIHTIMGMD